jgi:formiminoglutamase
MNPVEVIRGDGPVVLGMPHVGTWLPAPIAARLNANGRLLADTDWHVERLYDGLLPGATVVRATFHRYVVDANRDPSGASLYPGQNTTGLVPETDFDGNPIWQELPAASEVAARVAAFHAPYHAALAAEMARLRDRHGVAVLWDCHSIRSLIPFLFDGRLSDLNLGTDGGRTCAPALEAAAREACTVPGLTLVVNGRFRGGWSTRHYGRPSEGWHAIQMELAQHTHLATETPPFAYDPARAAAVRAVLARALQRIETLALTLGAPR